MTKMITMTTNDVHVDLTPGESIRIYGDGDVTFRVDDKACYQIHGSNDWNGASKSMYMGTIRKITAKRITIYPEEPWKNKYIKLTPAEFCKLNTESMRVSVKETNRRHGINTLISQIRDTGVPANREKTIKSYKRELTAADIDKVIEEYGNQAYKSNPLRSR